MEVFIHKIKSNFVLKMLNEKGVDHKNNILSVVPVNIQAKARIVAVLSSC